MNIFTDEESSDEEIQKEKFINSGQKQSNQTEIENANLTICQNTINNNEKTFNKNKQNESDASDYLFKIEILEEEITILQKKIKYLEFSHLQSIQNYEHQIKSLNSSISNLTRKQVVSQYSQKEKQKEANSHSENSLMVAKQYAYQMEESFLQSLKNLKEKQKKEFSSTNMIQKLIRNSAMELENPFFGISLDDFKGMLPNDQIKVSQREMKRKQRLPQVKSENEKNNLQIDLFAQHEIEDMQNYQQIKQQMMQMLEIFEQNAYKITPTILQEGHILTRLNEYYKNKGIQLNQRICSLEEFHSLENDFPISIKEQQLLHDRFSKNQQVFFFRIQTDSGSENPYRCFIIAFMISHIEQYKNDPKKLQNFFQTLTSVSFNKDYEKLGQNEEEKEKVIEWIRKQLLEIFKNCQNQNNPLFQFVHQINSQSFDMALQYLCQSLLQTAIDQISKNKNQYRNLYKAIQNDSKLTIDKAQISELVFSILSSFFEVNIYLKSKLIEPLDKSPIVKDLEILSLKSQIQWTFFRKKNWYFLLNGTQSNLIQNSKIPD